MESLFFLNPKFKPLAIFFGCTTWFVSNLVGNPEDRFSHGVSHVYMYKIHVSLQALSAAQRQGVEIETSKKCKLILQ